MTDRDTDRIDDQTLAGFLDWIAARYASRPALLYRPGLKTDVWTYRDLLEQADRVGQWLHDRNLRKGDRVIVWAPNGPWWVAVLFGTWRAGCIVVPLDARSSRDFVLRVMSQSEPALAIVTAAVASDWAFDVPVVVIEDLPALLPERAHTQAPHIAPDDLAEIIFTSGTTGTPKGVKLSHRNILSNVEAVNRVFPAGPRFKPLSILPLSHLLEQTVGLLLPLRGGTSIAYAGALQPAAIQRDMAEYRVTTMVLVPRILSVFMDAIERGVRREGRERVWNLMCRVAEHLPRPARRLLFRRVIRSFGGRLDFLVTGGAPLEPELEHKWELMGIAILQGYGATEASPIITATALDDRVPRSVGKALPGTHLALAEDGEIRVKGPNIMQGYWNNPDATAEALTGGYYNTGDLGELDSQGRLYLKGRKKNMIVLANGLNVFPEDVEQALRRVHGVVDAVVMTVPSSYGPQIHAVLLSDSRNADAAAIVRQANLDLAPHQRVRSQQIWPDADFPRTHTAKVKRAEVATYVLTERRGETLPQPDQSLQSAHKPQLIQIVADVLGKPADQLAPHVKLEDVGLDAARRIQLGRAVEDRLGMFVDDANIGRETTVGMLESLVTSRNPAGEYLYPLWPFSYKIRFLRALLQAPLFGAIETINRPRIVGQQRVRHLDSPAIFVTEYSSYLRAPFALAALPGPVRQRVGISTTWRAGHTSRLLGAAVAFLFNSFRYSPSGSLHTTLVHAAGLLDHRWSILFLLRDDPNDPDVVANAYRGIGLLAVEFDVPVVPIHIAGLERHRKLLPLPRRDTVTVEFGEPIVRHPGEGYAGVEAAVSAAMRSPDSKANRDSIEAAFASDPPAPRATATGDATPPSSNVEVVIVDGVASGEAAS